MPLGDPTHKSHGLAIMGMTIDTPHEIMFAVTQRHDGGVNVEMIGVEAVETEYGVPGPIRRTLRLRSFDEVKQMRDVLVSFIAFYE